MSNKNKVRILKAARRWIKSGEHRYICLAIRDASTVVGANSDALELKHLISERLQGRVSLENWLVANQVTDWIDMNNLVTAKKLRETRLAWIDSLIEEFS